MTMMNLGFFEIGGRLSELAMREMAGDDIWGEHLLEKHGTLFYLSLEFVLSVAEL